MPDDLQKLKSHAKPATRAPIASRANLTQIKAVKTQRWPSSGFKQIPRSLTCVKRSALLFVSFGHAATILRWLRIPFWRRRGDDNYILRVKLVIFHPNSRMQKYGTGVDFFINSSCMVKLSKGFRVLVENDEANEFELETVANSTLLATPLLRPSSIRRHQNYRRRL